MTDPHTAIAERLEERARSYRLGGPSSEHTAAMLDEAAQALRASADEVEQLREAHQDAHEQWGLASRAHVETLAELRRVKGERDEWKQMCVRDNDRYLDQIAATEAAEADLASARKALERIASFNRMRPAGAPGSYQRGYDIGFNNAGLVAAGIALEALRASTIGEEKSDAQMIRECNVALGHCEPLEDQGVRDDLSIMRGEAEADLLEAAKDATVVMARAFERLHSMPRVSDSELADRVAKAKERLRLSVAKVESRP